MKIEPIERKCYSYDTVLLTKQKRLQERRKEKKRNSGRKPSIRFQSTPWYQFRFGMNETGVEKSSEEERRRKQRGREREKEK